MIPALDISSAQRTFVATRDYFSSVSIFVVRTRFRPFPSPVEQSWRFQRFPSSECARKMTCAETPAPPPPLRQQRRREQEGRDLEFSPNRWFPSIVDSGSGSVALKRIMHEHLPLKNQITFRHIEPADRGRRFRGRFRTPERSASLSKDGSKRAAASWRELRLLAKKKPGRSTRRNVF